MANPGLVEFSPLPDGVPSSVSYLPQIQQQQKNYGLNGSIKCKAQMDGWWEALRLTSVLENKARIPKDPTGRRDGPTLTQCLTHSCVHVV